MWNFARRGVHVVLRDDADGGRRAFRVLALVRAWRAPAVFRCVFGLHDDYGVVSIAYCKAHNIISGYDDGTFKPDATITRQEAASMIVKAMGVSKASDELYPDDSTIAGWAKDAVYKAKAAGLMKGYEEDGTFRPTGKITRAEAASIMVNALNQ